MTLDRWIVLIALALATWLGWLGYDATQHVRDETSRAADAVIAEAERTGRSTAQSVEELEGAMQRFSDGMTEWAEGQTTATRYAIALDTGQAVIVGVVIVLFAILPAVGVRWWDRRKNREIRDRR